MMVFSAIFLVLQVVLIINMFLEWNQDWVTAERMKSLLAFTIVLSVLWLAAIVMTYVIIGSLPILFSYATLFD